MKVSIELDRKDVLSLIAVFLLMLPDSGLCAVLRRASPCFT